MAGKVKPANLTSPTARSRLKRGRQPHWHSITPGKVHLGWQCFKGDKAGRWVLRRYIGDNKYRSSTLGRADDAAAPDGVNVLSFEQADAAARATVASPQAKVHRLSVRQAMARYIDYKRAAGQPVGDVTQRSAVHILPSLGALVVEELTAEILRRWLATMADAPAQRRPRAGQPQYQPPPATELDFGQKFNGLAIV